MTRIATRQGTRIFRMAALIIIGFSFLASHKQSVRQEKSSSDKPPVFRWQYATPESQGMSSGKLDAMAALLAERKTKKFLIIRNDKIIYEWFAPGWEDSIKRHYTASLAKALVGGMSLLAAVNDGYIYLDEPACNFIPEWKTDNKKSKITIRHLVTHTSGLEDAKASESEIRRMRSDSMDKQKDFPGWKGKFWTQEINPFLIARDSVPLENFGPGVKYLYSNPGIAMLTYAVTASIKDSPYADIRIYLQRRILEPIGLGDNEYEIGYGKTFHTDGLELVPSWGGGSFTARGIARIGLLMLHEGNWLGRQLMDSVNVMRVTTYHGTALPQENTGRGSEDANHGWESAPATTAGWYCNYDKIWDKAPCDAFAGGGAQNQHLLVIPSLNMVVVRMGGSLGGGFWPGFEKYLINPLMNALDQAPYPQSDISVVFAPKETVIRMARGGDNWPATWGDDDDLYVAYGDGNGFKPSTDIKLSLGLAKVAGNPPFIKGTNIRSRSGERVGQGRNGEKASGMLMVDGTLYMLVRNAQNAVLMWSEDHGLTWEEADWKFEISFGCPTFLDCGKDYKDAPDEYVYIYSHDEESAYKNSDHFVLARVKKTQIRDWTSYEYYTGCTENNTPQWSEDIRQRCSVFTNPGECSRSGVSYNKKLKKYLWCQIIPVGTDSRFKGGLGIFESSTPWGPWKTVYYTRDWDIGPGDTASIPTKWISDDGKTCYMLFSGDDSFSIRKMSFHAYE